VTFTFTCSAALADTNSEQQCRMAVAVRRQVNSTLGCLNTWCHSRLLGLTEFNPLCYDYLTIHITQQLTVMEQWKEWLATIPDGKLPTNQKIEG